MITSFLLGLTIGLVAGLLIAINNKGKADAAKEKGKALLEALKRK